MEIRQLKYFVAVAEELHFGRAANRLHMSQPPLSQQIKKFEEELGVELFVRSKRGVKLSDTGKILYEDAQKILGLVDDTKSKISNYKNGATGELKIGYIAPAFDSVLAKAIQSFKEIYPNVNLVLQEMFTNDQLVMVKSKQLDLGVVRLFNHQLSGIKSDTCFIEKYVVAVPEGSSLAKKEQLHVSDLDKQNLILFPKKSQPLLYDEWFKVFTQNKIEPVIVQETEKKNAAISLCKAGVGVAIVPKSLAKNKVEGVLFKDLIDCNIPVEFSVIYHDNNHFEPMKKMIDLLIIT